MLGDSLDPSSQVRLKRCALSVARRLATKTLSVQKLSSARVRSACCTYSAFARRRLDFSFVTPVLQPDQKAMAAQVRLRRLPGGGSWLALSQTPRAEQDGPAFANDDAWRLPSAQAAVEAFVSFALFALCAAAVVAVATAASATDAFLAAVFKHASPAKAAVRAIAWRSGPGSFVHALFFVVLRRLLLLPRNVFSLGAAAESALSLQTV